MLTISRTLMGDPELIMIDEPTEGLAPLIVKQIGDLISEIAKAGVSILLVEQKLSIAMDISHRVLVMGHGQIVFEGTPQELRADEVIKGALGAIADEFIELKIKEWETYDRQVTQWEVDEYLTFF